MPKIAIVTDSTANLPAELISQHNIQIVPLKIHWGEETLEDGVDITVDAFYNRLRSSSKLPTTSQPSIHNFLTAYQNVPSDADGVIVLTLSSGISGTNASATAAASEFTAKPIRVVDTRSTSAGLALVVENIAKAIQDGANLDEVAALATKISGKLSIFFMVDTLEYLHKGGRIGGAARFFGSALNIKPILYLNDEGKIDTLEKVRTSKQALSRLLELAAERTNGGKVHARILQAQVPEAAEEFKQRVVEELDCASIGIVDLSPVLGAHVGPGTIGLAFFSE